MVEQAKVSGEQIMLKTRQHGCVCRKKTLPSEDGTRESILAWHGEEQSFNFSPLSSSSRNFSTASAGGGRTLLSIVASIGGTFSHDRIRQLWQNFWSQLG